MRAPSFDRIISRSLFTLFQCEGPPINFIAKLTVSGVSQTMIGALCRAPACLVYLDRDRIADAPPPLNTPQQAVTFSLPILPTYSALFKSPSFFSLFRLFLFYPSCLPLMTNTTTTRARPRPRLLTEVPQVAPFLSGARKLRPQPFGSLLSTSCRGVALIRTHSEYALSRSRGGSSAIHCSGSSMGAQLVRPPVCALRYRAVESPSSVVEAHGSCAFVGAEEACATLLV